MRCDVDVFAKHGETGSHYREELECPSMLVVEYRRKFPRDWKVPNTKGRARVIAIHLPPGTYLGPKLRAEEGNTRRSGETVTQTEGQS